MRILVVEDEAALREELKMQLVECGFGVDVAADGEEGFFAGLNRPLDAAVVDVGLPFKSGLDVIRDWRKRQCMLPVVVLTAQGGWRNRANGIDAGADDYVEKPFSFKELLTRLRCVIRRANGWRSPEIVRGSITLNRQLLTVSVEGVPVDLTTFEFRLLEVLMLHAGKVLSPSVLSEYIYDEACDRESNVVQHFICRLRRRLDPTGRLKLIETVYGGGYRFVVARGSAR